MTTMIRCGGGGTKALKTVEITSSGRFTVPYGVSELYVFLVGGGGGGCGGSTYAGGPGGGGGYASFNRINVTSGETLSAVIGSGGIGGARTGYGGNMHYGTDGGATSLGSVSVLGGRGNPTSASPDEYIGSRSYRAPRGGTGGGGGGHQGRQHPAGGNGGSGITGGKGEDGLMEPSDGHYIIGGLGNYFPCINPFTGAVYCGGGGGGGAWESDSDSDGQYSIPYPGGKGGAGGGGTGGNGPTGREGATTAYQGSDGSKFGAGGGGGGSGFYNGVSAKGGNGCQGVIVVGYYI